MIRALYSAASGMTAQQTNLENIAHNLANANTTGFKTRRAQFQDLLYQTVTQPGTAASQQAAVPSGLQLGLGTRAASNEIIFSQGDFSATNNPLDLVIQGRGFFQNVPGTRRQGIEASLQYRSEQWAAYIGYAHASAARIDHADISQLFFFRQRADDIPFQGVL